MRQSVPGQQILLELEQSQLKKIEKSKIRPKMRDPYVNIE